MKLSTKLQKLVESEKDANRRGDELSRNVFDLIEQRNINVKRLCADVGLSRAQYYWARKNKRLPTETLKKILNLEVFKQIDNE